MENLYTRRRTITVERRVQFDPRNTEPEAADRKELNIILQNRSDIFYRFSYIITLFNKTCIYKWE